MRQTLFAFMIALLCIGRKPACAELTIGTYANYPPWTITDDTGTLNGFEIDLMNDLCGRMETTCHIRLVDWEEVFPALSQGLIDAYIGSMSITAARRRLADFSIPYANTPSHFAALAGSAVTSQPTLSWVDLDNLVGEQQAAFQALLESLRGRRIGVHVETTHADFAQTYLADHAEIVRYETETQQYADLVAGRIDVVLDSSMAVIALANAAGGGAGTVAPFGPALTGGLLGSGVAVAMPKTSDALRRRFDAAIRAALDEGTLVDISLRWFGFDITSN